MSDDRWRQIEDIFHRAVELAPEARSAFLDQACGADQSLRREVESLLAHESEDGTTFIGPAGDAPQVIAHYRIVAKLGEGGMGSVYRATDTRLGRDVAIKVLPPAFAEDAARMARFEREAQVLVSLNHPNIATIYGIEQGAIVMELVEGEDLKGPVPVETAVAFARQIAAGLEAAHEKDIVHRDLKPANIKVTADGVVKLLDFGLAKAGERPGGHPATQSPPLSLTMTQAGMILGTAAYMTPEQARGKLVDKRADIWAFGVVLFELLTGTTLFGGGETVSDALAAVIAKEPDWPKLPRETPAHVRRLLERCLRKDPKLRLRDIGEARIAIDEAQSGEAEEPAPVSGRGTVRLLLAAVVLLTLLLAGMLIWTTGWFRPRPAPLGAAQFQIAFPEGTAPSPFSNRPELVPSPDGRRIAFIATSQGTTYLWVQSLDAAAAQRLEHTEGAHYPFWSPDGKSIAFFVGNQLKRVSLGGDLQIICSGIAIGAASGTWNVDGTIVFSFGYAGLMRVSAAGGNASPVTRLDVANGEIAHGWPQFLPDGRHFLYFSAGRSSGAIYVQQLGSDQRILVLRTWQQAVYASGYLLFVRQQTLFAQPFDLRRFQIRGDPSPVVRYINVNLTGWGEWGAAFAASQTGVLAYRSDAPGSLLKQLTWYDRQGKSLGLVGDVADYSSPALSPDGNWLAVGVRGPASLMRDIWLFDLLRGARLRVTSDPADDLNPTWSPDGSRIAFTSDRRGHREIYIKNPFGTAAEQLAAKSAVDAAVEDWSPDDRWIAYNSYPLPESIVTLSVETRKNQLYTENADHARFSPDGKWVAYRSPPGYATDGEVYIQPFPATGARWQISTAGGNEPQWRGDGRELFYVTGGAPAKIMAVDIAVKNGAIQAGIPHALFAVQLEASMARNRWLVTRDGQKFLAPVAQEQKPAATKLGVIYNWPALLEKR